MRRVIVAIVIAIVLVLAAVTACTGSSASGPATTAVAPKPSPAEIDGTLRDFLHHFENLEWEPFIAAFTDDACVFHPTAATPRAFCGRDAVRAKWQQVFDETRKDAKGPPYMSLVPRDLRITILGSDAALATFELVNDKRHARRSVVFVRRDGAWKIVHIHASNVPWPDMPTAAP